MSVQSRGVKLPLWQRTGAAVGVSTSDGDPRRFALPWARVTGTLSAEDVATRLGGRAGVALGVLLFSLVLIPSSSQSPRWVLLSAAVLALGAGAVLLVLRRPPPMVLLDALLVVADGLLVGVASYNGPQQSAFPGVYLVIGTIIFAARRWTVVAFHTALLGASYAGVLAVGPAHQEVAARWWIVMMIIVVVGVFVRWLVSTVTGLAVAEHAARELAESATHELERESEARTHFLARMSHELRTPLNVVLGFADLLGSQAVGPLNDKQLDYVRDVGDSARHLVALVDDALDLDHVERGDVRLSIENFDLATMLADSVVMVRDTAYAKQVEIVMDAPAHVGVMAGDRMKIRQVVVNLLANAVRFTPPGGRIEVRAFARANRVHVEVDDTGPGVAPADRDRIFEEYGQAEGADGGTGLGLTLAKRFVELHGGSIWMQNRPGGGSSFRFWVPRVAPGAVAVLGAGAELDLDADYSAFTRPGSRANREMLGRIGPRMFMVSGIVWSVVAALMSGPQAVRLWLAGGAVAFTFIAAFIGDFLDALTFRQIELFGWFGTIVVTVMTAFAGPFTDVVPFMYSWITMITFALWPRRNVLVQFAGIAVFYAIVLIVRDTPNAASHWVAVMTLLAFNAETVSWITRRLRDLVVAEQAAHRNARQVRAQLAAASRHKSSFVANMSHELRTPLNAVIGFTELLGTGLVGPLNEAQREYIADIDDSARHLLSIINDVLDAAKLKAGQLTLQPDVVPLRALLERSIELGNPRGPAHLPDIRLDIEPGLEYLVGDRQRLEQVMVQLVSNAVKFSPDGSRVDVIARRAALDELHISVADSGIGVLPSQYERIFDEFHQASLPSDRLPSGTGLGLSLARGLVEIHGGHIWVTSRPDRGSTFTVALPASVTSQHALEEIVRST
ncbi:MAG TPA: ATP-binding protein [Jatrophihabitantaceae bacterium]|nr:ATP-binding protein [Jatrophihabitantaceae bacterium]